ncbi:MAG: response regulator [Candidatus Omnitrophica bacterium]|nr:response regulator [Candidatus Omnitrophota bacterium]MDE2222046.1 response regulator [Candidatus Omnitrophota bacterium]
MSSAKTILVIDDEVNLQTMVKMTLQTRQYNVVLAGNGLEGLEQLKTVKPDLIILDMNMPKMGGLEFYQRICEDNRPKYPVLVLTARANMEQLFKQFNIDGFMSKPFEIEDLLKEVDTIIAKNSGIKITTTGSRETRKVCIVENNQEVLNQIGGAFLSAGYTVNPARNGVDGIERIANTVPDIALVKLGLVDIAGDMVITKLKNMAKTRDVKYILYTEKSPEKTAIARKIGQKEGVDRFVEFTSPKDFIDAAAELLA